jgi:hypothetical protein
VATLAGAAVLYAVALAAATFPYVGRMATDLPTGGDPPQHVWIMRWYRTCLVEGRSPFLCRELQYPVGAPLSGFSPLHVQSAVFLPLSFVLRNDILCYNLIWSLGMVTIGLGTFALAWRVGCGRAAAAYAGLAAMLSGPVMLHAHGHLEMTYLGAFPVFLLAWLRFLERPTRGRLAAAACAYVLLSACAAYFMVMAPAPAVAFAAWLATRGGLKGVIPWLRERLPWLGGFVALAVPCLAVLFVANLWGVAHGQSVKRTYGEFLITGAPLLGYVLPTRFHTVGQWLPFNLYSGPGYQGAAGYLVVENGSYLGVVTVALLAYALIRRVTPRGGAGWWLTLGLLVALSAGAATTLGGHTIPLPSGWLWAVFPPFRLTRCPARFNLLAAVLAAVVAASALQRLLGGISHRLARRSVWGLLCVLTVADLSMVPYWSVPPGEAPACYAAVSALNPRAAILELPTQHSSTDLAPLDRTLWQSEHRLATSAGYSGMRNDPYDVMIYDGTPFPFCRADFPHDSGPERFGVVEGVRFLDYARLFLTYHKYDYVVSHRIDSYNAGAPASWALVDRLLAGAKVFEDTKSAVYATASLPPSTGPALLCTDGWDALIHYPHSPLFAARRRARLVLHNPDSDRPLILALAAAGVSRPRGVRLLAGDRVLATWFVPGNVVGAYVTPPFLLPAGTHELILESDGDRPLPPAFSALDGTKGRLSLFVHTVRLEQAPSALAGRVAARESGNRGREHEE